MKRTILVVLLALGLLALPVARPKVDTAQPAAAQTPAFPTPPPASIPITGNASSFAPVVAKVSPGVVSIYTTKTVKTPRAIRDFFGLPGSQTMQGLGSGVIVSSDGLILTNNHVTDGADHIKVGVGMNGQEYVARKIGGDPGTDLALLKIEATNLPALEFADSDKARVGDLVLAVGNPFGLTETVTLGIISGLGRTGMGIVDYENFIQTDASINPGNSGGALVDMDGRVLGINTAIYSKTGGNQGIGFAVPANLAKEVLQSIKEKGRVIRGYLGALVQTVTPELAEAFQLKESTGALIGDITPGAPADKAGMKSGDVIVSINAKKITDPRQMRLLIGAMAPGTSIEVKLLRSGKERTLNIVLGELPEKETQISSNESASDNSNMLDGVTVADLPEEIRNALQIPATVKGAIVTEIDPDSPCYRAGLRQGAVIQEIDHNTVENAEKAVKLSNQIKKHQKVLLRIWTEGKSWYLALPAQ